MGCADCGAKMLNPNARFRFRCQSTWCRSFPLQMAAKSEMKNAKLPFEFVWRLTQSEQHCSCLLVSRIDMSHMLHVEYDHDEIVLDSL